MKKILLIEDHQEVRENTAEILELANFEVITAPDGKIGVAKANTAMPDLIICDIMMPELDGYGVLHILNKNPATASIPFIFLTAKAEEQLHAAADWYAEQNADVADKWFKGIVTAINDLGINAERFGLARENDVMPFELHERRYGLGKRITHRVLFVIRPDKIVIHQIRHVAQRDINKEE